MKQDIPLVHDIGELENRQCRWPIGEPGTAGFGFCGRESLHRRKPYCAEHHDRAYVGEMKLEDLI